MSPFPKLRELNVSDCKHLTLAIAAGLSIKCSRLEGFKFNSWGLRDTDKFLEFLCQPSLRDEETQNLPFLRRLSLCLPTTDGVEYFLQNRKGIEEFTHLNLFNEQIIEYPELPRLLLPIVQRCPKLTRLPSLRSYSLEELQPVLAHFPQNLERLEEPYDQQRFTDIVSRATSLKKLNLRDGTISDLSTCTALEWFRNNNITLSKAAASHLCQATNLHELELKYSTIEGQATQQGFNQLIAHFTALKSLRLDHCHSEDTIHIEHPSLESVLIGGDTFSRFSLDCPKLSKLEVIASGKLHLFPYQGHDTEEDSEKEPSLLEHLATHNPRLRELRLHTIDEETNLSFDFSRFSELTDLNACVRGLDDRSYSPLVKCCNLMKLEIKRSNITSAVLENILLHCKHLSCLWVSDCPNVTSLDSCCSESLSFIGAGRVSVKTFKPIGLPNLRKVDLFNAGHAEEVQLVNQKYLDEVEIVGMGPMKIEIRDAPLLLALRVDTMHLSLKLESTGLRELTLHYVTRRDEDLIEVDCPNLERLHMVQCKGWTFEMVEGYTRRHPKLKRLQIGNSCTEEQCLALAERYPVLEEISWNSENESATLYTRKTGEDRIKRTRFIP